MKQTKSHSNKRCNVLFITGMSVALIPAVTGVLQFVPCRTKDNQLRVDCKFPSNNSSATPYCEFLQNSKLLGSTDPGARPAPIQGRVNVTMVTPNMCRLSVDGIDEKKASTYTCRVLHGKDQEASTLLACSAISVVFQFTPGLLRTMMSLPLLLGFLLPY
uniref:Uncharacterized protein n=1 Tax=Paramormyrops kingsleyae TaxID=1676925 RepID=A0A3B3Q871_9TELE